MEILKITPDLRYYRGKEIVARSHEEIPYEERDHAPGWYLTGQLEEMTSYDCATVTNCKSGGFARPTLLNFSAVGGIVQGEARIGAAMCLDGIVDVEVEGINKKCIGYFWTEYYRDIFYNGVIYKKWDQCGYVCFADDVEARQFAEKEMKNK